MSFIESWTPALLLANFSAYLSGAGTLTGPLQFEYKKHKSNVSFGRSLGQSKFPYSTWKRVGVSDPCVTFCGWI